MVFPVYCKASVFISGHGVDHRLLNLYSPWMISRCVEVTSVAKVNKKLLVILFCIATRAPGLELLPPNVGSMDKLDSPASLCTPLLTWLVAPWASSELAPRLDGEAAACSVVCPRAIRLIMSAV